MPQSPRLYAQLSSNSSSSSLSDQEEWLLARGQAVDHYAYRSRQGEVLPVAIARTEPVRVFMTKSQSV